MTEKTIFLVDQSSGIRYPRARDVSRLAEPRLVDFATTLLRRNPPDCGPNPLS
jgi:hypothetical protein